MPHKRFIFIKDLDMFLKNRKDKTCKMILTSVEKEFQRIYGKDYKKTKAFQKIRNEILDSINDLYADFCLSMDNYNNNGDNNGWNR